MISGDNMYTAIDCAKKAGIIREGEEKTSQVVMNGEEFRNQVGGLTRTVEKDGKERYRVNNKQAFKKIVQNLKILARATPDDKFTLVAGLQEINGCVAMTADGINDAKALRKANVGFCMGISG